MITYNWLPYNHLPMAWAIYIIDTVTIINNNTLTNDHQIPIRLSFT
jgi:hypothetical protein